MPKKLPPEMKSVTVTVLQKHVDAALSANFRLKGSKSPDMKAYIESLLQTIGELRADLDTVRKPEQVQGGTLATHYEGGGSVAQNPPEGVETTRTLE